MGDKSKKRPSEEMWRQSLDAFQELIITLKPERILVLGIQNWDNLLLNIKHQKINDYTVKLIIENQEIITGHVIHPSSGGGKFTYKKWHPIANKVILKYNKT